MELILLIHVPTCSAPVGSMDEKDLDCWIRNLFARLFSTNPTPDELELCRSFFKEQADHFLKDPDEAWQKSLKDHPEKADQRALAALGQTLLASNRFLYVE